MEREERQIHRRHIRIAFLIGCAVSLVLFILSVSVVHLVLDRSNVWFFCSLIVIGLMVTRIVLLLLSDRPKKRWLVILWCVLLTVYCLLNLCWPNVRHHHSTRENAKERFEAAASEVYQIRLDLPMEVGEPESLEYHQYIWNSVIFLSRSYALICQYRPEEYEMELAAIESRYHFRTEALETGVYEGQTKRTIEPVFSIGDDQFRFLQPGDDSNDEFYRRCILVFTNDVTREIGYLVVEDHELDYVKDLTEYMNEECGWKYIR